MPTNNSDLKHKVDFLQDNPAAAENNSFEDKNRAGCKLEYLTPVSDRLSLIFFAASLIKASEYVSLKILNSLIGWTTILGESLYRIK